MKLLLVAFFSLVAAAGAVAQPVVKPYGFVQEIVPGTIPVGVTDENGKPIERESWVRKEYRIFLSYRKTYSIVPTTIFIKGEAFSIKSVSIAQSPVIFTPVGGTGESKKTVLVPAGTNKVIELEKGTAVKATTTATLRKLIASNELVVVYIWKGRKYYSSLKALKQLESANFQ